MRRSVDGFIRKEREREREGGGGGGVGRQTKTHRSQTDLLTD